jgi:hypothetical protein
MIKTGILGTSETANFYASILMRLEGFELTGCYSPDYGKTKNFATQFNLVAYPSMEALFNYTEALIITEFSPDFLSTTEKAIKNFKHILITNPFLAGFDEIQHLRKLSEESGVLLQIAGGFKFHDIVSRFENRNCFLTDLKHSFGSCNKIWCGAKFMEYLLNDISLQLILLKGSAKKININSWEVNGHEHGVVSIRLELDNGNVANLLVNQFEEKNTLNANLYCTEGESVFQIDLASGNGKPFEEVIANELHHLELSIKSSYSSTVHNDIMFQALELAHRIKSKSIQNFAVNFPN